MLILLSPAKIQNFEHPKILSSYTQPDFLNEASLLVEKMKSFSATELESFLRINSELAVRTSDRFFNWSLPFTLQNAKQTILVFNGEVFHGLDAKSFSPADFEFAQEHLRIFSGLYGILRPYDLIQPYRLDVADKLLVGNRDLYHFWREKITSNVIDALNRVGEPIVNLMSNEYFKILDKKQIDNKVVTVEFLQGKDENYKSIVIYTKKARGLMARFIIKNQIEDVEYLKAFNEEGYWFNSKLSNPKKLVFTRVL